MVREHHPEWIVLQCEAITDVDVTAAEMLKDLDDELNAAGVHLAFAELRERLRDLTFRYGLFDTLDRDHFYPTLDTAVAAVQAKQAAASGGR
jgi:MFS superfamily sulfate permease-like transporter